MVGADLLKTHLMRSVDGGTHLQHLLESGFVLLKVLYLLLNSILSATVEGRSWKERRRENKEERERD